jgi:hypothetical protein
MTIGELVDESIDNAAKYERDMAASYLRRIAGELPELQLFPPNLTGMVTDLLLDLADDFEACEHYTETKEEGATIQ